MNTSAVFTGPNALATFLQPEANAPTPLVELPRTLNAFAHEGVRIFAKLAYLSPLFTSKQLAARHLLQRAKDEGRLNGVHTLVENSSGNMAASLIVLARQFGISRVVVVVPRDIAPGKLELLRVLGADIEFHTAASGSESGVAHAQKLGRQRGWLNLGQYQNEANPEAYERYLAPQVWEQTGGKLSVFCAGLGTTGTLLGSRRYLKERSPAIAVLGVVPRHDAVPGVRSARRLEEVAFAWEDAIDHRIEVEPKEAFKASLALCRSGILAGPSSGMALAGLREMLAAHKVAGTLDTFRNAAGEVVAAFVCPDSALLYLEKYSTHLDPEDFQ